MLETHVPDSVEVEARSLEDAVAEALARLGARREEVEIETLQEGSSGFLGLGGTPFRIRATRRADPAAVAIQALRDILAACEIPGAVTGRWDEGYEGVRLDLEVDEEDSALLVGRRGQTLNAFQYLTAVVAGRRFGRRVRVVLDIDGFRDRRAESLEGLARRAAREARETGRPVPLDPMPPQDRRIIHLYLAGERGVECHSEGEGRERHIVVSPTRQGPRRERTAEKGARGDDRAEGERGDRPRGRGRRGGRSGRGRRDRRSDAPARGGVDRRITEVEAEPPRDDDFVPPSDAAIEWVKKKNGGR